MQNPLSAAQDAPCDAHAMPSANLAKKAWVLEATPGFLISANSQVAQRHRHQLVTRPGLRLIMLLEGELSLRFDRQRFHLLADEPGSCPVLLVDTEEEILFERLPQARGKESKVCMTITEDWLDQHGLTGLGRTGNAAPVRCKLWHGDTRLGALARQLIMHDTGNPLLTKLEREMLGMQLLGRVIEQFSASRESSASHIGRRLEKIRDMLESGEADLYNMTQLAEAASMSSSTLQRHFRREYGCSVMDYLRGVRLDRARSALRAGRGNITTVALDAGYNSPANFATAFRRRFGVAPSQCLRLG